MDHSTTDAAALSVHGEQFAAPDGWEWRLIDVTCEACGAVSQIHEQPAEWLETAEGVRWECPVADCRHVHQLGGHEPVVAALFVLECGECHSTFNPNEVEIDAEGYWTCPTDEVANRYLGAPESATSSQQGTVLS